MLFDCLVNWHFYMDRVRAINWNVLFNDFGFHDWVAKSWKNDKKN